MLPAAESFDEAFARLQLTFFPGRVREDLHYLFPGPLPDDERLLRCYVAALEAFEQLEAREADRIIIAGSTAEGRDLADEVRRLQRERPAARAEWAAYCVEQTNGIKYPLMHSVSSLRQFLEEFDL